MHHTESNEPESEEILTVETNEERLLREIEDLKRQLEQRQVTHPAAHTSTEQPPRRSSGVLTFLFVVAAIAVLVAFFAGYLPRKSQQETVARETAAEESQAPGVNVVQAVPSQATSSLVLPGNVAALTEAPILARADGYLKSRNVDIGDKVKAGQLLAEIDAPDLDQQVRQAAATLSQTQAALEQAKSNYQQGQANQALAAITAKRWAHLVVKGAVSLQENDQYQAQLKAQTANLDALNKAIEAAKSNVSAAQANLGRLKELQGYEQVRAPFTGVITVRNVDVGALITTGQTLIYRIAQTNVLRTYVDVPQGNAPDIRVGQPAVLKIPDLAGRQFVGHVTRVANALDPSSRTMLTEVQVPNPEATLRPGMYALVDLNVIRKDPPIIIPGDALVVRANGTLAAVVGPDQEVHFRKIDVGRDFGDKVEVLSGLSTGDLVVVNPSDVVQEGVKVKPVPLAKAPASPMARPATPARKS